MALIDNKKEWILLMFNKEINEGRGEHCQVFSEGKRGSELLEEENVLGIYKNKYFFTEDKLFIKEKKELKQIEWAKVTSCSTKHGSGRTFSLVTMVSGEEIKVRVGDLAKGWSGRISQLFHQMIEKHGSKSTFGKPLITIKEFLSHAPDEDAIAPNLDPHPGLNYIINVLNELKVKTEKLLLVQVEDEDNVIDKIIIVTKKPEDLSIYVERLQADGLTEANENYKRQTNSENTYTIIWD